MTDEQEQKPQGHLSFDKEAFYVSLSIHPLVWGFRISYDEEFFCYDINIGPFLLSIGQPFWRNEFEYEEGNVIFLESRTKRDALASLEDDYE